VVVGGLGSIMFVAGTINNWIQKRKLQAQELANAKAIEEMQTTTIRATTAKAQVEQNYETLQKQYEQLSNTEVEKAELLATLEKKEKEIQNLITERNQLAKLVPDKESIKKLSEIYDKVTHVH